MPFTFHKVFKKTGFHCLILGGLKRAEGKCPFLGILLCDGIGTNFIVLR